ncbi:alpha-amylase family glycosyl hydrolase [Paenibacillus chibensis]|uniref:Alpha-amylase family glycosyl hydrolase n=1 Tax=Paenibacillus chibensis TaxID=59846 RepID=A0ABU6PZW0_9BACL|nr:alpha-amylase family glycosyl hydrolase [Paenibacillus chibensis]
MRSKRREHLRLTALLSALLMVVQMIAGSFSPIFADAAAETSKSTYTEQGKIYFQLPKSSVHVMAVGTSESWKGTTELTDQDNDGTYTAEIQGLQAEGEYAYHLEVNGMKPGEPDLTAKADDQGTLQLAYTPAFSVTGSFDPTGEAHRLTLSDGLYAFTTGTLSNAAYTYSFMASAEGYADIRFLDPGNAAVDGPDNVITVSEPDAQPKAAGGSAGLQPDELVEQPGGASKWVVAGSFQDWNVASEVTRLKHLTGDFYEFSTVLSAGHHEFKIVRNGNWDDSFSNNGNNFAFDLTTPAKVNFYVNEKLRQARINIPGVQGLPQYTPKLAEAQWPRLVGDIQPVFGEPEWSPSDAKQMFVDTKFDGSVYELQRSLPAGNYKMKVVLGNSWNEDVLNYGDSSRNDFALNTLDPADVIFSIDLSAGKPELSTNYKPADASFDGKINKSKLYFDSRSITYKKPFGAIKEKEADLTLRIAAESGDLQAARVELTNPGGLSKAYDMHIATSFGGQDYWEITIPKTAFQGIGIWNYKFILIDGMTKVEYGDDNTRGGTGTTADEGVLPYDLTVYKSDFVTPDWMKNAVVYQIFPDRFLDGDPTNNRAKIVDGYRGGALPGETMTVKNGHKLQFFDGGVDDDPVPGDVAGTWTDVPENPDRVLPENKPYYPDAKTDGIWTNEFYGGDIQGVGLKLDYLKALGVNVIYFNPVAWAASNHKYDATDYKHLDPMFGKPVYNEPGDPTSGLNYEQTRAASDRVFTDFAKQARAKGIKLIVDGVFNHVGDDSIYFDRYEKYPEIGAYEYWSKVYDKMNADSSLSQAKAEQEVIASFTSQVNPATGQHYAYPEDFDFTKWFKVTNEKVDGHYKYEGWWGYDSLPVIDAPEPAAGDTEGLSGNHEWNVQGYRDQVIGHDLSGLSNAQADQQMQQANSQRWEWLGARGWRLDVAPDVSSGTWEQFRKAVKSTAGRADSNGESIDDPIILGEEWGVATKFLLGDQFDSVMNYRFRNALQTFVLNGNATQFNDALESIREDYPEEAWEVMLNLVDSHDTIRSITKYDYPSWEEEHLKIAPSPSSKAMSMQALTAIFQMSYPGAPTIYYGDEVGLEGTKDPDSRRTFPWERVSGSDGSYAANGAYADLFATYQKAANIRNNKEVFRTGALKVAYDKGDVIAYARKTDAQAGLVVINRGSADVTVSLDVAGFLPSGIGLTDQLGSGTQIRIENGKANVTIKGMSGLMMTSDGALEAVSSVKNVQAQAGNQTVTLTWDAVPDANGYHVYRAPIEGGTLEQIGVATDTIWNDTKVQNGTKYFYAVTAVTNQGESSLSEYASATPSYPISSVEITQQSSDVTLGAGNKTSPIQVTLDIPGLSDQKAYSGKEMPGITAKLLFYKEGTDPADADETKLRYLKDDGDKKVYWAAFEPTEPGTYYYFAKVSTDHGEHYTASALAYVGVHADPSDVIPPSSPVLAAINTESSRAQLEWTAEGEDIYNFEIYRKQNGGNYKKLAVLGAAARSYIDYTVSNDTQYTYKVAAVDVSYNRSESAEQSVTPKLVMVDVKLRLHLPSYTPVQDDIYIAGDFNGWNQAGGKLNVPSGATTRDVVEYSFKMMAGKAIQYKYTRGTWATEALTSHARLADDSTDMSNYAYSSENTNMKLTIQNQGGNKMTIDDYVLRWVDMPMIITLPRTSYGEPIAYETEEAQFTLKANVPYGSIVTINGQPIPAGTMDAKGNVQVTDIPLAPGLNRFSVHAEPSAETLNLPWYEDPGRASKATKTMELAIHRTSSGGDPGTVLIPVTGVTLEPPMLNLTAGRKAGQLIAAVQPAGASDQGVAFSSSDDSVAKVSADGAVTPLKAGTAIITVTTHDGHYQAQSTVVVSGKEGSDGNGSGQDGNGATGGTGSSQGHQGSGTAPPGNGKAGTTFTIAQIKEAMSSQSGFTVILDAGDAEIVFLPLQTAELLQGKSLQLKHGSDALTLPAVVLEQLAASASQTTGLQMAVQMQPLSKQTAADLLSHAGSMVHASLTQASAIYDFKLLLIDSGGKVVKEISEFSKPLLLTLQVNRQANQGHLFLYCLKDDGKIEFIDGKLDANGTMTAELQHFSKYAVLEFNKKFLDVPADHWASAAVSYLAAKQILTGTAEDRFEPSRSVTRAEFAALIARTLDLKAQHSAVFADVSADQWYAEAVAAANEAGIVEGRSQTVFAPEAPITREEMAVMLIRAYQAKHHVQLEKAEISLPFTDASQINQWARDAVQQAVQLKLLTGDGSQYKPLGKTTRAESAQVIYKLLTSKS